MTIKSKEISVVLVDDHANFRRELAAIIGSFSEFTVPWQAGNGKELILRLTQDTPPDIVLLDINMPEMDGFETAAWLRDNYPAIKVMVLSMLDNEKITSRMLGLGASAILLKDVEPAEIKAALLGIAGQ